MRCAMHGFIGEWLHLKVGAGAKKAVFRRPWHDGPPRVKVWVSLGTVSDFS